MRIGSRACVQYRKADKWLLIAGAPLATIILVVLFAEGEMGTRHFFLDIVFMTFAVLGACMINRGMIFYLSRILPWDKNPVKRTVFQVLANGFLTLIFVIPFTIVFHAYFDLKTDISIAGMATPVTTGLLMVAVINVIYESSYFFNQWKQSLIEKEKFEKESIHSQYSSLKNQINPHFLFNSFNVLSSLITKDPSAARDFVDQLSDVYRYVLNSREKELVDLKTEMAFVRSYIYLLEKRHGDSLKIEVSIDRKLLDFYIPPLSLQMLIENAVKHNVIAKDSPLHIRIVADGDAILVRNNLQRKSQINASTKIGLQNIRNRYKFLSQQDIDIMENESVFTVKLPLLKPAA